MTIHFTADIQSKNIGEGTVIWQYAVVLKGAVIGRDCNINCHTFIENNVIIGDRVTVKSGAFIWDGIILEDDVFVGPNVTFVNDNLPRSKSYREVFEKIIICKGASIGANATILGGITIGAYAMIGAGAVVTKNIPPFALCYGNPAKILGKVNEKGIVIEKF